MEDFSSEQSGGFDSSSGEQSVSTDSQGSESTQQPSSSFDLDRAERVSWQGKEYTSKDLKNMFMARADYTRRTQEVAKERHIYEALGNDLEHVKNNPALVEQFKQAYPEKYHAFLKYVTQNTTPNPQQNNGLPEDPRISKLESQMTQWQQERYNEQVKALNNEIDGHLQKGLSKYADVLKSPSLKQRFEIDCINLATQLNNDKVPLNGETWDKITKSVSDDLAALLNIKRSDVVKKQTQAHAKGKDIAPGGGVPGQAPKAKFKNLRQAMTSFLEEEGL